MPLIRVHGGRLQGAFENKGGRVLKNPPAFFHRSPSNELKRSCELEQSSEGRKHTRLQIFRSLVKVELASFEGPSWIMQASASCFRSGSLLRARQCFRDLETEFSGRVSVGSFCGFFRKRSWDLSILEEERFSRVVLSATEPRASDVSSAEEIRVVLRFCA